MDEVADIKAEVADIKTEIADLKAQVAEIKSLVEFIASEATEKPTAEPTPAPTVPPTAEKNGCGEPCADKITISSTSFPTVESGTCYVVDGTFPSSILTVPDGVDCAKITVPSDSSLLGIVASSSVLLLAPKR